MKDIEKIDDMLNTWICNSIIRERLRKLIYKMIYNNERK